MGKYKGDWYCGLCEHWVYDNHDKCWSFTTDSLEAEYVMTEDMGIGRPPQTDRTAEQKRNSFFIANGCFMPHSKPKYRT